MKLWNVGVKPTFTKQVKEFPMMPRILVRVCSIWGTILTLLSSSNIDQKPRKSGGERKEERTEREREGGE